ncbi:MAG: UbiA family prenyltransferase [Planctomycetes bacterium]|nr:UbiA family prenyltransferase [Planctomycetota bacterium]
MPGSGRLRTFASLVKLSHSVFALPFALLALLAASGGAPGWRTVGLVVLAVVAARTAAMAYNRFVDRDVDAQNPRTAQREIPRGAVAPSAALGLVAFASGVFLVACWLLSTACLWLGLPTLAWLLGYSHCKRFTSLSHLWLGIALGVSPVAAWFAHDGAFGPRLLAPVCLGAAVAFWVAGFDVLYACQDEGFDRGAGLHSIPARFGARTAMHAARLLHGLAFVGFVAFGVLVPLGAAWLGGCGLAAALLVWQHRLLSPHDLSRIDMAFFTANGTLAMVMFAAGCVDLWWLLPHRS